MESFTLPRVTLKPFLTGFSLTLLRHDLESRPLPEPGLFGMAIPTSGRTIPVTRIVVKKTVGIVSDEALKKKKGSPEQSPNNSRPHWDC